LGRGVKSRNKNNPKPEMKHMNRMTSLIIAALIIAFVLFAVAYWIFRRPISFSVNLALSGALGGLVAELVRTRMERKKLKNAGESKDKASS
jgi:membrane associated rhomboid family serine protease